jgi:hypothetical protein
MLISSEKYCWLISYEWFVLREKYRWLEVDKPSEQGVDHWFLKSASPFRSASHAARGGSIIPHPGRRAGARAQSMKRASCSHRIGASCHKKGKELERHFANSKSHPLSSSSCSLQ